MLYSDCVYSIVPSDLFIVLYPDCAYAIVPSVVIIVLYPDYVYAIVPSGLFIVFYQDCVYSIFPFDLFVFYPDVFLYCSRRLAFSLYPGICLIQLKDNKFNILGMNFNEDRNKYQKASYTEYESMLFAKTFL